MDLFATRSSLQLRHFYSWQPDTQVEVMDAYWQDWSRIKVSLSQPSMVIDNLAFTESTARDSNNCSGNSDLTKSALLVSHSATDGGGPSPLLFRLARSDDNTGKNGSSHANKARSLVAWPISSDCLVQEPFIN